MIINTITYHTVISGEWVEVITERHRQDKLIREMHTGAVDGETMSASNSSGHTGINKTIWAVCSQFYWSDISGQVRNFVNSCHKCQMKKDTAIQKMAILMHPVSIPIKVMSQIGIDLMRMKETPDGYNYAISATDYFTKFIKLGAIKDKCAVTIRSWIYEHIFCMYD